MSEMLRLPIGSARREFFLHRLVVICRNPMYVIAMYVCHEGSSYANMSRVTYKIGQSNIGVLIRKGACWDCRMGGA